MKEAEGLKKKVEQAWLQFEDDGSIQTYLLYQQLSKRLEALQAKVETLADKRD